MRTFGHDNLSFFFRARKRVRNLQDWTARKVSSEQLHIINVKLTSQLIYVNYNKRLLSSPAVSGILRIGYQADLFIRKYSHNYGCLSGLAATVSICTLNSWKLRNKQSRFNVYFALHIRVLLHHRTHNTSERVCSTNRCCARFGYIIRSNLTTRDRLRQFRALEQNYSPHLTKRNRSLE